MSSLVPVDRGGALRNPPDSLELAVSSRRRVRRVRRWLGRAFVGLVVAVVLAFAMPAACGLSRATVSDDAMSGTMGRGSVVFTRARAVADLEVGDVITYRRPSGAPGFAAADHELVTRRIVDIKAGEIWTSGDRTGAIDPWTITPGKAAQARAVADVPYAGYVYDAFSSGAARLAGIIPFVG